MKKGFTLAEVLITLAIIGVVAAITIPSLVSNSGKHGYEVGVKKFYSNMSRAIRKYMADEGVDDLMRSKLEYCPPHGDDEKNAAAQEATNEFVRKYFNVVKECDSSNAGECFSSTFKNISGNKYDVNVLLQYSPNQKVFVLSDETVLTIQSLDCYPLTLYFDINGKKKPNIVGYDIWNMDIFYDGSIDESNVDPENKKAGRASQTRQSRFEDVCLTEGNYGGCFGHFLENGFKIDY